ncbi:MAG: ABC transporter ATP-binding protein [Nitrospiraceae bacterium]
MSGHDIAIKVSNLSKCYHIYDKPSDRLKQFIVPKLCRAIPALRSSFPTPHLQLPTYYRDFWALKDVSFEIKKGEAVGIIGRNGSGKSTLLQMICGTVNSTSGNVQIRGRIAALLELGSGFNPEFTGCENVYMNAAVLGLSKEEIDSRFDEIKAFADIGNFIDQPLKTYSSGMVVRLAFAVAINVAPDILIIDEALSVGDELFQQKCFSRIKTIRASGATILFVSHSGAQIVEICDHAVLLDAGELLAVGMPKKIVGRYQKLLYAPADRRESVRDQIRQSNAKHDILDGLISSLLVQPAVTTKNLSSMQESFDPDLKPNSTIEYESRGAYIENVHILDIGGNQVNNLIRGKRYRYAYVARFCESASNVRFGMLIKTVSGVELGGGTSAIQLNDSLTYVRPGAVYRVEFSFQCSLNPGIYFLSAGIIGDVNGEHGYLHRLVDIVMFRIMPDSSGFSTGIIDFSCVPEIEGVEVSGNG